MKTQNLIHRILKTGIIKIVISILIIGSCATNIYSQEMVNMNYFPEALATEDIKHNVYTIQHAQPDSLKQVIKNIIVEFIGSPSCALYSEGSNKPTASKAIQDDKAQKQKVFRTFSDDVDRIYKKFNNGTFSGKAQAKGHTIKPKLHQKYSKVFFGQKITIDSLMIAEIRKIPYVKGVYEDRVFKIDLNESVPQISADSVWNELNSQGDSVQIGIIDTGIDYNHTDLGGGYGEGHKVIGGYDFVDFDNDPMDENSHGTHVAGIVAADGAVKGVAPKALLWAIRVLDAGGSGWTGDIISGIEYSADPNNDGNFSDKLDVVNMSLGGYPIENDPVVEAVENATNLGVTFCIAAGNSGEGGSWTIGSPGIAPSAITVGAVDKNDVIAYFSSKGPAPITYELKPDVVAPGVHINSTMPNDKYAMKNGTSMATPHIAGVCALLKRLHPEWQSADLKSAIMSTAKDLGIEKNIQGTGRVDAYQAALVNTFLDLPTLNFGIDSVSGIWNDTITLKIRNISDNDRNYLLETDTSVMGVTFAFDSINFSIAANQEKKIRIAISVNSNLLPDVPMSDLHPRNYAGSLKLHEGSNNLHINWSFLYAIQLKFNQLSDNIFSLFVINEDNGAVDFFYPDDLFSPLPNSILIPPGRYSIITSYYDNVLLLPPAGYYIHYPAKIVFKKIVMSSGATIDLDQQDAKHKIIFSMKDENGNMGNPDIEKSKYLSFIMNDTILSEYGFESELQSLSQGLSVSWSNYHVSSQLYNPGGGTEKDTLLISDLPENVKIIAAESRLHKTDKFNLCYKTWGPYFAQNKDTVLTNNHQNYQKISFQDKGSVYHSKWTPKLCFKNDKWQNLNGSMLVYLNRTEDYMKELDIFMMPMDDMDENYYYSLYSLKMYQHNEQGNKHPNLELFTDPFMLVDNEFFFGYKKTADKYLFSPGDTAGYGTGTNYQKFMSWNNYDSAYNIAVGVKSWGPFNEFNVKYHDYTNWKIYDQQNNVLDSSGYNGFIKLKQIPAKYHLEIISNQASDLAGIENNIYSNLDFDLRNEDANPPTLTSFFITNGAQRQTYLLRDNDTAQIRFSIGDYMFDMKSDTFKYWYYRINTDSARLFVREHASGNWQSLPFYQLGEDSTEGIAYLGKFAKPGCDSAYFDVKVAGVDDAGNRFEQLFSPAIFIRSSFKPTAINDSYHVKYQTTFSSDSLLFTSNDINPAGLPSDLSYGIINNVKHGSLILNQASFDYTPATGFLGIDSLTYFVKNEFAESNQAVVKFLVELNPTNIPTMPETKQTWVRVFPNPVSDLLNIQMYLYEPDELNISVFDITGKKVAQLFSGDVAEGEFNLIWNIKYLNGVSISPSVYLLQVEGNSFLEFHKIIIKQ